MSGLDVLAVMHTAERELMLARRAASKARGDRRYSYKQSEQALREARAAVDELIRLLTTLKTSFATACMQGRSAPDTWGMPTLSAPLSLAQRAVRREDRTIPHPMDRPEPLRGTPRSAKNCPGQGRRSGTRFRQHRVRCTHP